MVWSIVVFALLISMSFAGESQAAQSRPLQLVQSCLAPAGQVYCGYYNNECINCYSNMPYYCPPQAGWPRGSCHSTVESAQGLCGQAYAICGAPVN